MFGLKTGGNVEAILMSPAAGGALAVRIDRTGASGHRPGFPAAAGDPISATNAP